MPPKCADCKARARSAAAFNEGHGRFLTKLACGDRERDQGASLRGKLLPVALPLRAAIRTARTCLQQCWGRTKSGHEHSRVSTMFRRLASRPGPRREPPDDRQRAGARLEF